MVFNQKHECVPTQYAGSVTHNEMNSTDTTFSVFQKALKHSLISMLKIGVASDRKPHVTAETDQRDQIPFTRYTAAQSQTHHPNGYKGGARDPQLDRDLATVGSPPYRRDGQQ